MGLIFPKPMLTEEQWLSGEPEPEVLNWALCRNCRKFALAQVAQFRHIYAKLHHEDREAVCLVETHADDFDADGRNPHQAAISKALGNLCLEQAGETMSAFRIGDLRDIFGNPFRPVSFDAEWRTSTAVALAKQMYESRDFSTMPILADALQDAGCINDDILSHCRDANGVHVRGCWVVDMVLGKS